jgi:uncharacterized protein (UPF0216 family)
MKVLIALSMYDTNDICRELAQKTNKASPYSRARVDRLIKDKLPTAQMLGKHYYLTEKELNWLAEKIDTKKRPKTIDKKQ